MQSPAPPRAVEPVRLDYASPLAEGNMVRAAPWWMAGLLVPQAIALFLPSFNGEPVSAMLLKAIDVLISRWQFQFFLQPDLAVVYGLTMSLPTAAAAAIFGRFRRVGRGLAYACMALGGLGVAAVGPVAYVVWIRASLGGSRSLGISAAMLIPWLFFMIILITAIRRSRPAEVIAAILLGASYVPMAGALTAAIAGRGGDGPGFWLTVLSLPTCPIYVIWLARKR